MTTYLDQLPLDLKIEEAKFVHKEKMKFVRREILEHVYQFQGFDNCYNDFARYELAVLYNGLNYCWSFTTRPRESITNVHDIKLRLANYYLKKIEDSLHDVETTIKACKNAGGDCRKVLTSFYNRHI
jgi:hypothetical protein